MGKRSQAKLRDYKVMVRVNQGILIPTMDGGEGFRKRGVRVQQAVEVRIRRALTKKVMISFMFNIDLTESMIIAKLIEKVGTVLVGLANIEISSKIDLSIRISIFEIINTNIQLGKFIEKVRLSPERW